MLSNIRDQESFGDRLPYNSVRIVIGMNPKNQADKITSTLKGKTTEYRKDFDLLKMEYDKDMKSI